MRYFYLLVLLVFWAPQVYGWHTITHLQMTRDAIALMPAEFQETFTKHQKFVEQGVRDPDELLRDWPNHFYIPVTNEGKALERVDKIVKIVQTKFQNSTATDTSKQLCYLAHYIGDMWMPENLIRTRQMDNKGFLTNNDIIVFYEGYQKPIEDVDAYLRKRMSWRWKLENSPEISTLLYSEAVNDIARIWLTLWQQAGHQVEPQKPSLIAHNKDSLDINFERLLREERVYWYSSWDESSFMDAYDTHQKEVERLNQSVAPSEEALYARAELRNQKEMLSKLNPDAPFKMLETSLKAIGDKAYFVARVENISEVEIPSIAFMHKDVRGPLALVKNLKPGLVAKVEATVPLEVQKDQIQLVFATPEEE